MKTIMTRVDAVEVVKGRANKDQRMEEQEFEVDNSTNEKAFDARKDISMGGTKDNSATQKTVHKGKATEKLAGKGVSRRQGRLMLFFCGGNSKG